MNGKYTTGWQLIRIPLKMKDGPWDGRVQQFCSTHIIRPLGTCEEEFFHCSIIIIESKKLFE